MSCGVDFSLCLKPLFYSAYFARQFSDLVLRSYRSTRLVMISSQFCNCIKPDCPRPSHCRDGNAAPCKNGWSGEAALVRDGKVWCRPVAPSGQVVDPDFANGDFCAYGSWWRSQHLPPLMSAFVKLRRRSRRCSEWLLPALSTTMCMLQHRSIWAQALNRFAIGALVVGVVLNRDLFRVL